jgi:hypothetical protein
MDRTRPDPPFEIFTACRKRDLVTLGHAVNGFRKHLKFENIVVATGHENFGSFERVLGTAVTLIDEDSLIPGMTLDQVRKLKIPFFPQAAGWYFQQLLKYAWSFQNSQVRHFLIWDADTVLLRPLSFFDEENRVLMTKATEYHALYFETFERLFGFPANYEFSFISQHQMIDKMKLQEMLASIHARHPSSLNWAWAILEALPSEGDNLFSEYETYGHWMKHFHPDSLQYRNLPWLRDGTQAAGFPPKEKELERLARDYFFVAFEQRARPLRNMLSRLRQRLGV